jgi:hypothetical protein
MNDDARSADPGGLAGEEGLVEGLARISAI